MKQLPFSYAYFSFKTSTDRHELRVWVTPYLSLEWKLYCNDELVGALCDEVTNVLIDEQMAKALCYANINRIYAELLAGPPVSGVRSTPVTGD